MSGYVRTLGNARTQRNWPSRSLPGRRRHPPRGEMRRRHPLREYPVRAPPVPPRRPRRGPAPTQTATKGLRLAGFTCTRRTYAVWGCGVGRVRIWLNGIGGAVLAFLLTKASLTHATAGPYPRGPLRGCVRPRARPHGPFRRRGHHTEVPPDIARRECGGAGRRLRSHGGGAGRRLRPVLVLYWRCKEQH